MQKIAVEIPLEWKELIEDRYGLIEDWLFNGAMTNKNK